jgi:hypothetical protein
MARFFETFEVIQENGHWMNTSYPVNTFDGGISVLTQDPCNPVVTTSSVQTATMGGAPTGGTFTLTFGGHTTTALAFNETSANVQSALVALSSIGAGNVSVSGAAGGPWVITFQGTMALTAEPLITATNTSLTGGTSPGVTVASTTTGGVNLRAPNPYPLTRLVEPFAITAYGEIPPLCAPPDYEKFITNALDLSAEQKVTNTLWYGSPDVVTDMYMEHTDVQVLTRTGDPYTMVGTLLQTAFAKTPFLQPVLHLGWQSAMSLQLGLASLGLPFVVPRGYPSNAIAVTGPVVVRLSSIETITTFDYLLNRQYFESSRIAAIEFDPGIAVRIADS